MPMRGSCQWRKRACPALPDLAPTLIVIGRTGGEPANIVDILKRRRHLDGHGEELGGTLRCMTFGAAAPASPRLM